MSARQQRCSSERELRPISGLFLVYTWLRGIRKKSNLPGEARSTLQSRTLSPNSTFARLLKCTFSPVAVVAEYRQCPERPSYCGGFIFQLFPHSLSLSFSLSFSLVLCLIFSVAFPCHWIVSNHFYPRRRTRTNMCCVRSIRAKWQNMSVVLCGLILASVVWADRTLSSAVMWAPLIRNDDHPDWADTPPAAPAPCPLPICCYVSEPPCQSSTTACVRACV